MPFNNDSFARRIAAILLKLQIQFALFMSKVSSAYPARTQKLGLIVLCSLFLSLSSWFIIDAVTKKIAPKRITVTHIRFIPSIKMQEQPRIVLTQTGYRKLQQFRHYLDSLRHAQSGKLMYDSIVHARPGLLDSIAILENIYLSNLK